MAKASGYQEEIPLAVNKNDHVYGLMNKFNQMRMQMRECDLVIKVGGKEISVHRNVMMVGSEFFDAMFTHDMQEKRSGVVEMKDISFRIFNKCVEFIYTGDISVTVDDCEELLFVAGMLQLTSVSDNIGPFLQSHLSTSSFFATKRIAEKYSLTNLKKVCNDFALANLDKIAKEKEFCALEREYISFLITTKKSTDPLSEDSKMAIVLQWIKADVENRKQYLIELATLLDFQRLSAGYGTRLVKEESLCFDSGPFMKMLFLGVMRNTPVEQQSAKASFGSRGEKSLVVFDRSTSTLRGFNPKSKNWTQMESLHPDMYSSFRFTAVMLNNYIYVFLGNGKAFRLNIKEHASVWKSLPAMKNELVIPRAAVFGEDIYVVNGSMESFHPNVMEWREINLSRDWFFAASALVVHDQYIYTIGGCDGDIETTIVNRFSPLTSSWSSVAPMRTRRRYSSAAVYNDRIYVAGGYRDGIYLDEFSSFNPRANMWTELPPMSISRSNFGFCVVENKLYAVGDRDQPFSIEMYDVEEGRWKFVTNKEKGVKIMASATLVMELPDS